MINVFLYCALTFESFLKHFESSKKFKKICSLKQKCLNLANVIGKKLDTLLRFIFLMHIFASWSLYIFDGITIVGKQGDTIVKSAVKCLS